MKKHIFLLILLTYVQLAGAASSKTDKVVDAIEVLDLALVKRALKRIESFDARMKKELLGEAEDKVDTCKQNLSIFKSRTDSVKLVCGSLVGVAGLIGTLGGLYGAVMENATSGYPIALISGGVAGYSFYKAFCGLYCETAYARLAVARKILDEIKKIEVVEGEPVR